VAKKRVRRMRVYIDNSVFGGCFDEEFAEWSNYLIGELEKGEKIAVISDLTLKELENAPAHVKEILGKIPDGSKEYVLLSEEAKKLSLSYIEEGVVSKNYLIDAQHIAIATVEKIDVLVSWNFRHIVNLNKIHLYNGVNLKKGYPLLEIRSPREVLYEKEI
jgi:hypothetical protein